MSTPKSPATKANPTRGAKTSSQTLSPKSDKKASKQPVAVKSSAKTSSAALAQREFKDKRTARVVQTPAPKPAVKNAPKTRALSAVKSAPIPVKKAVAAAKKTEPKRSLKASTPLAKSGSSVGRATPASVRVADARPTAPPQKKLAPSTVPAANAPAKKLTKPAPASKQTVAVAVTAPASQAGSDQRTAQVEGLQAVLALSVAEGVFLIVAAAASFEGVRAFARYESDPVPRFVSEGTYLAAQKTRDGPVIYTTFVPWPSAPVGPLGLGCITTSGRKPVLSVKSLAWAELSSDASTAVLTRFGRALLPAAKAVLPERHGLRLALQPVQPPVQAVASEPTSVLCHFDAVVDGLAHGWVYDKRQPGKALEVEILHQGEVVARGIADRYRDDLERIGIGNGCHHFRLSLSHTLFDGQLHVLDVRVPALGAVALCPPLTCSLVNSQPAHLDAIPRAQTLALARELERRGNFSQPGGDQALLAAFDQHGLHQETWLLDEARAGYLQLAEVLGDSALCNCKIAETWLLDYQLPEALEAYAAAARLDPQMPWAHLGMGNVLRLQSQPVAALAAYRTALKVAPGLRQAEQRAAAVQADAACASARQLEQAGDKAGATALLRATVLRYPDHEGACDSLYALLRDSQPPGQFVDTAASAQVERARYLLEAMLDEFEQRLMTAAGAP